MPSVAPKTRRVTRAQASADTRDKLIEAGAAEFSKHGLAGARIQAITKAAGVALGTFYVHFKDKEDLFNAVIARGGDVFLANVEAGLAAADNPKERDWAAIDRAVAFAETYPELFKILMAPGAFAGRAQSALAQMIVEVRRAQYPAGKAEGVFWNTLDEQLTAIIETGVVFVLLNWWMDNKDQASRSDIVRALINVRRYGVEIPPADGPDWITADDIKRFEAKRDAGRGA